MYCSLCFDPADLVCKTNLCSTEDAIFTLKTPCNPRKINIGSFYFVGNMPLMLLGQWKEISQVLPCNYE